MCYYNAAYELHNEEYDELITASRRKSTLSMDDNLQSFDTGTGQFHTAPTHVMLVDDDPLAECNISQTGDDENQPPEVSWTWTVDNAQVNFTSTLFYQLINQDDSKLGGGSYGTVYRYDCSETGKTVAIKKIRANAGRKQVKKYIRNFSREISVHMNLDHRNVLKFIDKIEFDEVFALVVEFAENGSLTTLMGSGELERKKIIYYSEQILCGLEYLHNCSQEKKTIVHKDLRCDNVLMDKHRVIKLADFGISKALNVIATTSGIPSESQSLVGHPFWNAPEQMRNDKVLRASQSGRTRPERFSTAKDIWSLGVLMLEIYYYGRSRVPFMVHYTYQTYIYKLGEAWIPKTPDMAPSELKSILKQCFSYEPEDRPTASYLLKQIKTFNIDIGELELEPITDLNFYGYPKKDSEFDSTPVHGFDSDETPGAVNDPGSSKLDHSTDKDDKEDRMFLDRSLKRLHELTMFKDDEGKAKYHTLTKNTTDLALFHTKSEIILQLEDNYYSTSYYDIRELNGASGPQDLFKMFIDTGYCGYQHDLLHNDSTLLSFSTKKDIGAFLTFKGMAGGTAQASHSSPLKKKLKLTDKRMKVYPINPEGNNVMRALSPRPSRKIDNPGTPGSSSTNQTAMSLKYEDLTMSINKIRNGHYDYVIKFKEDDVDVAYIKLNFSKSNNDEKDGCLIKVLPENNKALASTVAAYYYWHKAKQRKRQPIYQRFVSSISSKFGYNGGSRSRLL